MKSKQDPAKAHERHNLLLKLVDMGLPAVITDTDDLDRLRSYEAAKLAVVEFHAAAYAQCAYATVTAVTPDGYQAIRDLPALTTDRTQRAGRRRF